MCGRFSLAIPAKTIAEYFETLHFEDFEPRYNIAPTQPILAIWADPKRSVRAPFLAHWGLVPSWAKDMKIGARLTNARAETLAEKPSFRAAFKYRRCLIPVDGFYEWKREGGRKQPYHIRMRDKSPFVFAGLWEHWSGPAGEEILSATIVTTTANQFMQPIHHRMPVILEREHYATWLDPENQKPQTLDPLLRPLRDGLMTANAVDTYVNRAGNEGPRCIGPLAEDPLQDDGQYELF